MRIDVYLVTRGYVESRQKATAHIKNGAVTVDEKIISKPSEEIDESTEHNIVIEKSCSDRYVSRGALKLAEALVKFNIDVNGAVCIDIGASTGGFTDCLLQNGAKRVYALDSGKGQLHPRISSDTRVISKERFNARYLSPDDVGTDIDVAVMDVSFISQTLIIPRIKDVLKSNGIFISLIKPQFEAGREALKKNGIVKKWEHRLAAAERVISCAVQNGFSPIGFALSPIKGGDGNEEYLACFVKEQISDFNRITEFDQTVKSTIKTGQGRE